MNYIKLFGIAAFAIGAILYLASADDHDVVMGHQDYQLEDFVKVSVNTSADVKVRLGREKDINVTGDEDDLKYLKVYVKGQTLVIENKKNFHDGWRGDTPEIEVFAPVLKQITVNGSSDTEIRDLDNHHFKAVINGSGNIELSGQVADLRVEINGSGDLLGRMSAVKESAIDINGSGSVELSGDCGDMVVNIYGSGDFSGKKFKCQSVSVNIVGAGDMDVYASEEIVVDVMGSGDVNVYGDPSKVKDKSRRKDHVTLR